MLTKVLMIGAMAVLYGIVRRRIVHTVQARIWLHRVLRMGNGVLQLPDDRAAVCIPCEGAPVTVRLSLGSERVLSCAVPGPLPRALEIGPDREAGGDDIRVGNWRVDEAFGVRSESTWWARETVGSSPAVDALRHGITGPGVLRVRDGLVSRRASKAIDEDLLVEAGHLATLAVALADSAAACWAQRGAAYGLSFERIGRRGYRLMGRRGGVPVQLAWTASDPRDPGQTTLDLALSVVLPADLRVVARAPGAPGGLALGDLILDRTVRAEGADVDVLRALLARDDLRPLLLDLLHGAPGARLEGPRIRLVVEGPDPDALLVHLDAAAELARCLCGDS